MHLAISGGCSWLICRNFVQARAACQLSADLSTVQTVRAFRLAKAIATNFTGFLSKNCQSQSSPAGVRRQAAITPMAPRQSRRRSCQWLRHRFERPLATRLPIFKILSNRSMPWLEWGFGLSPSQAVKSRADLKPDAFGMVAARTLEVIGPIPGIAFRRRATASVYEVRLISALTSAILILVSRNCSAKSRTELSALAGKPSAWANATSRSTFCTPFGTTKPNSPRWARVTSEACFQHIGGVLSARRIADLRQLAHQKISRPVHHQN